MWLTLDDVADLKKGKHCQKTDGNIPIIGSGKKPTGYTDKASTDSRKKMVSTTIASTKQFTEYLNDIYTFSYAKGVLLEIPQDLAWCRG